MIKSDAKKNPKQNWLNTHFWQREQQHPNGFLTVAGMANRIFFAGKWSGQKIPVRFIKFLHPGANNCIARAVVFLQKNRGL